MKKKIYFVLFFVIVFSLTLSASLLDVYKSGEIKLVPDPNFGKGTDWDIYFPQGIKDIAFAKDGSFFATGFGNRMHHCVYKFDKDGKFLKKIGRKGKGPGDLYGPGDLSILDNKYLFVNNYDRRISIFDLNGNFIKVIKTKEPVYDVVGLKNNKIAFLTTVFKNKDTIREDNIYIINIFKDIVQKIDTIKRRIKPLKGGCITLSYFKVFSFIGKSGGKIIFSKNNSSKIIIYDFHGQRLNEFKLDIQKEKIDKKIRNYFYKRMKRIYSKRNNYYVLKALRRQYKNGTLLPEYKPYYRIISLDTEGNIILLGSHDMYFEKNDLMIKDKLKIKIYNNKGEKIADINIGKKDIEEDIMHGLLGASNIWFFGKYLYYFDKYKPSLRKLKLKPGLKK